jgi:uncharacterized protein YecT (DUF1311 family)
MNFTSILRLSAVLLFATSLAGCFDVSQKVVIDKGELSYSAEFRIDAKLAAMSDKKGGACDNFSQDRNTSTAIKVETSESMADGNVVCKLSAQGPLNQFASFSPGDKENSLFKIAPVADGAWRIDSSFDMRDQAKANTGMEGMMEAMFAGRNLSWSATVPKVLETNGEVSKDGKTVTWSAPVASAYKAKQSFYLVFKAERPWYAFLLDLIDAIKKFFGSLFGGADKAAAPAAKPASNTAAPSAPAPAPAPEPAASAPAPAQTQTPAEAAPAAVETGPITASFDCAKASSAQEKMICSDRELARLDVELSAAYRKAREAATDAKALQNEQLQWLKASRKACSDKACLAEAYKSRTAELSR